MICGTRQVETGSGSRVTEKPQPVTRIQASIARGVGGVTQSRPSSLHRRRSNVVDHADEFSRVWKLNPLIVINHFAMFVYPIAVIRALAGGSCSRARRTLQAAREREQDQNDDEDGRGRPPGVAPTRVAEAAEQRREDQQKDEKRQHDNLAFCRQPPA